MLMSLRDDVYRKVLSGEKIYEHRNKFERTNSIDLERLRVDKSKFVVPQMYYYIENTELLDYLEEKLEADGFVVTHELNGL